MPSGATALLAAGTAVSSLAWAVRGRSSCVFGPSVWRGKPGRRAIALTFDDGPSPSTSALLEILAQYHARATFFQVGQSAATMPDISKAVFQAGHEIGNHSHTHPNFALKSASYIDSEFTRAQQAIIDAVGCAPAFLRAPYGVRWPGFHKMQHHLGLTGVMWSIIGLDWKLPAEAIAQRVLRRAKDGDIICLHDGRGTLKDPDVKSTLEAVRRIMPALLEKGYHFETVTQLLCPMK